MHVHAVSFLVAFMGLCRRAQRAARHGGHYFHKRLRVGDSYGMTDVKVTAGGFRSRCPICKCSTRLVAKQIYGSTRLVSRHHRSCRHRMSYSTQQLSTPKHLSHEALLSTTYGTYTKGHVAPCEANCFDVCPLIGLCTDFFCQLLTPAKRKSVSRSLRQCHTLFISQSR